MKTILKFIRELLIRNINKYKHTVNSSSMIFKLFSFWLLFLWFQRVDIPFIFHAPLPLQTVLAEASVVASMTFVLHFETVSVADMPLSIAQTK